ncbi:MAG: hypothetical protein P4L31_05060 [Candidatus Babeliales bacterium]|nr:hypothetical protein [Candidatus Babeliales bacterium]
MKILQYLTGLLIHMGVATMCAIDINATIADAYQHLIDNQYDQALALYEQAYHVEPTNGQLLCNLGFIFKKKNMMREAIDMYEKARPYISSKAKIERALSGAYLALGDFERGWLAYEYRWQEPPYYNQDLKRHLKNGGSLQNKILLIKTEYGLGDTLQFIRYARELKNKGAYIIVESQKPLMPLLNLCPYIDKIIPEGQPEGSHFTILLMSLPLIFETKIESIPHGTPYLFANQKLVKKWKDNVSQNKKIRIGICWQADIHKNAHDEIVKLDSMAKSIPLNCLAQLSELPNVTLYSLQKINGLEQLKTLPAHYKVHHFEHMDQEHGPFMDTAAIIMNMDLVITIDTSIAHLAGGLGKPVWLLLPYAADWRWMLNRDDSPWYPNMRLFRQQHPGMWQNTIDEIKPLLLNKTVLNAHKGAL